ncbi:MAG: hypothetical protein H6701_07785 [Myxococcales bacterium]|nr:hypothetical protein [Myxococcales bacterium]
MAEEHHPPGLPGALGEQFQVTAALTGAVGVLRYAVVDAAQTPLLLELAERATLFDDPLSAFHGAAALCFGPTVPPTPIAAAARALYRMHHPTIPRPRGVGTVDLRPWIITGRPSGQLLAERDGPWPPGELHALAVALFEALGHAHARGVIHRAVGIENVCWGPGGLGLVGWTAAAVDGAPPPDSEIAPRRRAPESWLGAAPTVAVDLYAAGVLLHRLAAGRPPFAEATAAWDHVHVAPPALPPSTPPPIAALCARLLAKDPARRPESARAALDLLLRAPVEVQGPFASAPTATAAAHGGRAHGHGSRAHGHGGRAHGHGGRAHGGRARGERRRDAATGARAAPLGAAPIGDDTLSSLPAMPALLPPRPAPDPSVDAPPADAPPADQSPAAEPPRAGPRAPRR